MRFARYFATLTPERTILWCYAIWYAVNVRNHFEPSPRLWLTSLGLAVIIGVALWLSIATRSGGRMELDRWQTFRFFLMPFCVSSFSALVRDAGYVLIFPPTLAENAMGFGGIALFLLVVAILKRSRLAAQ